MKKTIAIIIDSMNGGGAERVCLTLAQTLIDLGHNACLFVLKKKCDYAIPSNIPVYFLENNPSFRLHIKSNRIDLLNRFKNILKKHDPFDLYISNLDESHHLLDSSKLPNCLYVVHNSIKQSLKRSMKLGPIKYLRKRSAIKVLNNKNIVCVSEGLKQEILSTHHIKPKSIHTIYNPIDKATIQTLAKAPAPEVMSKPYVIHIGRFAKQKRHDILFKMMKLESNTDLLLLTKKSKKLDRLIQKFGLEDRVHIKEFIQNPYPLIQQAQALILCSDFEGFGLVISEALACNTPVISTDCPHGPSEQLSGKLKKYLVPTNDPEALLQALKRTESNKSDFFEVDALKQFDPRLIAQHYLNICLK